MTFLRTTCVASALAMWLIGSVGVAPAQGTMDSLLKVTSTNPTLLTSLVLRNDQATSTLTADFVNDTGAAANVVVYARGDASCLEQGQSPTWLTLDPATTSVPSDGQEHSHLYSIPFDTNGLGSGTYSADICFADGQANLLLALPVKLYVAAEAWSEPIGYVEHESPHFVGGVVGPRIAMPFTLTITVQDGDGTALQLFPYVQDDPSCPMQESTHAWFDLPLTTYPQVPSDNQPYSLTINGSFDGSAYGSGVLRTNICIFQQAAFMRTTAVPVEFRLVAADDIFQDSLE